MYCKRKVCKVTYNLYVSLYLLLQCNMLIACLSIWSQEFFILLLRRQKKYFCYNDFMILEKNIMIYHNIHNTTYFIWGTSYKCQDSYPYSTDFLKTFIGRSKDVCMSWGRSQDVLWIICAMWVYDTIVISLWIRCAV